MRIRTILFFSVFFFSIKGFIYQVHILRKSASDLEQPTYFIGLSDFHDKTHEITQEQLISINRLLEQFDKDSIKIILEDLSSAGCNGKFSCGQFLINSRGGILGGLAKVYRDQGHMVENVEYRYCRVSSLSPVLNNLTLACDQFPSTRTIAMNQLIAEIQEMIQEIQHYQDDPILVSAYKKGIKEVAKELKRLRMMQNTALPVADYLTLYQEKQKKLNLLKKLLTFDNTLIDFKMAHCAVTSPQTNVIAIAGGSHITRVVELLQKVGYESVYSSQLSYEKEMNLNNCLGSQIINDSYCLKPEPMNLDHLPEFFSNSL